MTVRSGPQRNVSVRASPSLNRLHLSQTPDKLRRRIDCWFPACRYLPGFHRSGKHRRWTAGAGLEHKQVDHVSEIPPRHRNLRCWNARSSEGEVALYKTDFSGQHTGCSVFELYYCFQCVRVSKRHEPEQLDPSASLVQVNAYGFLLFLEDLSSLKGSHISESRNKQTKMRPSLFTTYSLRA